MNCEKQSKKVQKTSTMNFLSCIIHYCLFFIDRGHLVFISYAIKINRSESKNTYIIDLKISLKIETDTPLSLRIVCFFFESSDTLFSSLNDKCSNSLIPVPRPT